MLRLYRKVTHHHCHCSLSLLTNQLWKSTSYPRDAGSIYTIPHRDTVAGEATARSSGSNSMVMGSVSWMISPDVRQSLRLSSSTVFMFSILYTVKKSNVDIDQSNGKEGEKV